MWVPVSSTQTVYFRLDLLTILKNVIFWASMILGLSMVGPLLRLYHPQTLTRFPDVCTVCTCITVSFAKCRYNGPGKLHSERVLLDAWVSGARSLPNLIPSVLKKTNIISFTQNVEVL